jgi:hypothetical protein
MFLVMRRLPILAMQIIRLFFCVITTYLLLAGRFPSPISRYMFKYIFQVTVVCGNIGCLLPFSDSAAHFLASGVT